MGISSTTLFARSRNMTAYTDPDVSVAAAMAAKRVDGGASRLSNTKKK